MQSSISRVFKSKQMTKFDRVSSRIRVCVCVCVCVCVRVFMCVSGQTQKPLDR